MILKPSSYWEKIPLGTVVQESLELAKYWYMEQTNEKNNGMARALIAAAVNASVCEIWTDIDGMHNNDPRVVKKTVAIEQLSFEEAAELAYFGAKILHPASIWPAQLYKVPVKLLNTGLDCVAPPFIVAQE